MIHSLQTCVKLMIFLTHPQSIFQQWRLSSPRLPLWSDCKTLTALSRLFVSRRGFFAVLEVYKVPQGQGTLNTDRMCGVSAAHQTTPPPPWLAKLGARRVFRRLGCRRGRGEEGGDWGNYTQADSICFSSVLKHPPPLEHSYFQAFPCRRTDAGRVKEGLPVPQTPRNVNLAYSCLASQNSLLHVSGLTLLNLLHVLQFLR